MLSGFTTNGKQTPPQSGSHPDGFFQPSSSDMWRPHDRGDRQGLPCAFQCLSKMAVLAYELRSLEDLICTAEQSVAGSEQNSPLAKALSKLSGAADEAHLAISEHVLSVLFHCGITPKESVDTLQGEGGEGSSLRVEEKTFAVMLVKAGLNKIGVIKAIREFTGLGLREAKDLTDDAPRIVKYGVDRLETETIKAKLAAAGATAEVRSE